MREASRRVYWTGTVFLVLVLLLCSTASAGAESRIALPIISGGGGQTMAAPSPRLEIFDGTIGVLLNGRVGFKLREWRPARIDASGMVEETFVFTVVHWDQDRLIQWCRDVDMLLLKAQNYWDSNWQPEPVYLVAKGPYETETRYATIRSYSMGPAGNPYAQPFFSSLMNVAMQELTLTVVHLPWREFAPGRDTTRDGELSLTTIQDFGGTDFGHEYGNTGDWSHMVANKQLETNLTHIYEYDASTTTYTQLLGTGLPYELLPNPVADGDMCYFGIETAVLLTDSAQFHNLIFDAEALIVYGGTATMVWEYWNGAWVAFPALELQDNTHWAGAAQDKPFSLDTYDWHGDVSTVLDTWWLGQTDWATTAVNGVTGWWVRLRAIITTPPGDSISAPPKQQTRDVYTTIWNHVEIEGDDVGGDIPALARIRPTGKTERAGTDNAIVVGQERVYMGLRSNSRGTEFRSIWPFSQYSQYVGASTSIGGVDTAYLSTGSAPVGEVVRYNPAGAAAEANEIIYTFGGAVGGAAYDYQKQMTGEYHMFVRYKVVAGASAIANVRAKIGPQSGQYTQITDYHDVLIVPDREWRLMDFGRVHLGGDSQAPHNLEVRYFTVNLFTTATGACDIYFESLILLPIDEAFAIYETARTEAGMGSAPLSLSTYLDADGVTHERNDRAILRVVSPLTSADEVLNGWGIRANTAPGLQVRADQTVHFLTESKFWDGASYSDELGSNPFGGMAIRIDKCARYLSMRGSS